MADFNKNRSFGGRGSGKPNFRGKPRASSRSFGGAAKPFERTSFGGRDSRGGSRLEMHATVCAKCGERCEVPFKPNNRKPVYCSDCFRKSESSDSRRDGDFDSRPASNSGGDLRQINEKLDRILKILEED